MRVLFSKPHKRAKDIVKGVAALHDCWAAVNRSGNGWAKFALLTAPDSGELVQGAVYHKFKNTILLLDPEAKIDQ